MLTKIDTIFKIHSDISVVYFISHIYIYIYTHPYISCFFYSWVFFNSNLCWLDISLRKLSSRSLILWCETFHLKTTETVSFLCGTIFPEERTGVLERNILYFGHYFSAIWQRYVEALLVCKWRKTFQGLVKLGHRARCFHMVAAVLQCAA